MSFPPDDACTPYWNFFARADAKDIWCAVPIAAPLPRFLFSGEWLYKAGSQHFHAIAPFHHDRRQALWLADLNGFYLFYSTCGECEEAKASEVQPELDAAASRAARSDGSATRSRACPPVEPKRRPQVAAERRPSMKRRLFPLEGPSPEVLLTIGA